MMRGFLIPPFQPRTGFSRRQANPAHMLARFRETRERIMKRLVVRYWQHCCLGWPVVPAIPPRPVLHLTGGFEASPQLSGPSTQSPSTPVSECLSGQYRLVRFVGVGEKGTYGTGEDGDVTVAFNNGSYTLRGAGKDPIKLTLAGRTAALLINGTVSGDYQLEGDRVRFTVGEYRGAQPRSVSAG